MNEKQTFITKSIIRKDISNPTSLLPLFSFQIPDIKNKLFLPPQTSAILIAI